MREKGWTSVKHYLPLNRWEKAAAIIIGVLSLSVIGVFPYVILNSGPEEISHIFKQEPLHEYLLGITSGEVLLIGVLCLFMPWFPQLRLGFLLAVATSAVWSAVGEAAIKAHVGYPYPLWEWLGDFFISLCLFTLFSVRLFWAKTIVAQGQSIGTP